MITMWVLFGFMIMPLLAIGSCRECKKVNVTKGGNAILPFATCGLTFFYEIRCEERTKITWIGQYCVPADSCRTRSITGDSIETGRLTVYNVTYNRCYSTIPDKSKPGKETCYNVTVNMILMAICLLADQCKCKHGRGPFQFLHKVLMKKSTWEDQKQPIHFSTLDGCSPRMDSN